MDVLEEDIEVNCPYDFCNVKATKSEMEAHQRVCIYKQTPCPNVYCNNNCNFQGTLFFLTFETLHTNLLFFLIKAV